MSSSSVARVKKQALDRVCLFFLVNAISRPNAIYQDVLVSVLESSATRRDAKGYLQKYSPKQTEGSKQSSNLPQDQQAEESYEPVNIAVMLLREPQRLLQSTVDGIARTLAQLRSLGLLTAVVLDCGAENDRNTYEVQAVRFNEAVDNFGKPGAKVINEIFMGEIPKGCDPPSITSNKVIVKDRGLLKRAFLHGLIPIIPSVACRDDISSSRPAAAEYTVLALTAYLSGLQFDKQIEGEPAELKTPAKIASVERVILLDTLGGPPMMGRPGLFHRFINLEQEYDRLRAQLMGPEGSPVLENATGKVCINNHVANLALANETLSLLPPSSSALITTPFAAANTTRIYSKAPSLKIEDSHLGFDGMVTTRKKLNPILHNLLTDKPMFSPSLPFQKTQDDGYRMDPQTSTAATLVKRGMPLTLYPDPREDSWTPPKPGGPRPRLSDTAVDLPRLIHLIEDSFGRKLDVNHYLERVHDKLAGIIIAGEYEGGAILTWERPEGVSEEEAYEKGLYVPYLDKFAVLKSRQGSGGVADIVYNAMVRDCFPDGVCWRSRKTNPVNKWYFERSVGTSKLSDSNWTMFWTTIGLAGHYRRLNDYESVCRSVQPSWADNKHIID
jgi:amino-acid N-acetyltransferase